MNLESEINVNNISKVLYNIIIQRQSVVLQTSERQFGFKSMSSTVLYTSMITETIEYYNEIGPKPVLCSFARRKKGIC